MTLPNFIGIGAPKSGSTWLYELLRKHPDVYMPEIRKELDFFNFDSNYSKGLSWYESFFPKSELADNYKAIGEFTPRYIEQPEKCAKRIANIKSVNKLIVILRNPVNRTYSQYCHGVRSGSTKSFESLLSEKPWLIEHGLYARNLKPFLNFYSREQILCLIFEESVKNIEVTKSKLAEFLQVSVDKFAQTGALPKVNQSYVPKFRQINNLAGIINRSLVKSDLDWVIKVGNRLGIRQMLAIGAKPIPPLSESTKLRLQEAFANDIEELEKLLNLSLDIWKTNS